MTGTRLRTDGDTLRIRLSIGPGYGCACAGVLDDDHKALCSAAAAHTPGVAGKCRHLYIARGQIAGDRLGVPEGIAHVIRFVDPDGPGTLLCARRCISEGHVKGCLLTALERRWIELHPDNRDHGCAL